MTLQDGAEWFTVPELAPRLGVSVATLKRRISDGKPVALPGGRSVEIEAEMLLRPQGHEWRVRIKGDPPPLMAAQERTDSKEPPPLSTVQSDAQALTAALETVNGLVERNAALSDRMAALEREAGQLEGRAAGLEAERDAARAEAARLAAELERERRPWWRKLLGAS